MKVRMGPPTHVGGYQVGEYSPVHGEKRHATEFVRIPTLNPVLSPCSSRRGAVNAEEEVQERTRLRTMNLTGSHVL